MSGLFEEEIIDDLLPLEDPISIDVSENAVLDARRKLEDLLEKIRLQNELDDFGDYEL